MAHKEGIVQKGYDRIAKEYQADRGTFDSTKELEEFASFLPKNAKVLDVGCGAGVPVTSFLVEAGFDVVGIDFSQEMLRLVRLNVPKADFIKEDMTEPGFKDDSFDGLTGFYSVIHVPREKHFPMLQRFHRILKPNGVMLLTMGLDEWEAIDEYYGTDMFWSQYAPEKSLRLVKKAGFQIKWHRHLERGGEKHYWILARNKK